MTDTSQTTAVRVIILAAAASLMGAGALADWPHLPEQSGATKRRIECEEGVVRLMHKMQGSSDDQKLWFDYCKSQFDREERGFGTENAPAHVPRDIPESGPN